jgi:cation diffusion facilitator CzcD-associated flavoprotein CzcO
VIATGLHSEPFVPDFPGQNKFSGPIVSSFSIKSPDQVENKRVVIIGDGKSATELAVFAGRYAR